MMLPRIVRTSSSSSSSLSVLCYARVVAAAPQVLLMSSPWHQLNCTIANLSRLPPQLERRAHQLIKEYENAVAAISSGSLNPELGRKASRLAPVLEMANTLDAAENEVRGLREMESDPELGSEARAELPSALDAAASAAEQLTTKLVPAVEFADQPCLLEIRPGIGGSEAALFAQDLLTQYENVALHRNWRTNLVQVSRTDAGGISEAILHVMEPGTYGKLRHEGGVHRVQRVPATEAKGRVHTSTASVIVLPDLGESAEVSERAFAPGELRFDVMRASGAGGQHVNKVESAVRVTHLPTNTTVVCQDDRSQSRNRARALMILRGRLAERDRREKQAKGRAARLAQVSSSDRSDKVRTYNFPQNRVTDHRCNYSVHDLEEVLAGGPAFDGLVEACDAWAQEQAIEELLADADMDNEKNKTPDHK